VAGTGIAVGIIVAGVEDGVGDGDGDDVADTVGIALETGDSRGVGAEDPLIRTETGVVSD